MPCFLQPQEEGCSSKEDSFASDDTVERRSLLRRKFQVSKGKLISFPDKMECVLNFKRWSRLHSCGFQQLMVLLILQAASSPGKHSLNTQNLLSTYLYTPIAPLSSFQQFSQLQSHIYVFNWPQSLLPQSIMGSWEQGLSLCFKPQCVQCFVQGLEHNRHSVNSYEMYYSNWE